jgi:hypothetical protein
MKRVEIIAIIVKKYIISKVSTIIATITITTIIPAILAISLIIASIN